MTKPTMKEEVYKILSDGMWHGCSAFVHLGLSYRNRINELKQEGEAKREFTIESEKETGRPTFKYRMVPWVSKAPEIKPKETAHEFLARTKVKPESDQHSLF